MQTRTARAPPNKTRPLKRAPRPRTPEALTFMLLFMQSTTHSVSQPRLDIYRFCQLPARRQSNYLEHRGQKKIPASKQKAVPTQKSYPNDVSKREKETSAKPNPRLQASLPQKALVSSPGKPPIRQNASAPSLIRHPVAPIFPYSRNATDRSLQDPNTLPRGDPFNSPEYPRLAPTTRRQWPGRRRAQQGRWAPRPAQSPRPPPAPPTRPRGRACRAP